MPKKAMPSSYLAVYNSENKENALYLACSTMFYYTKQEREGFDGSLEKMEEREVSRQTPNNDFQPPYFPPPHNIPPQHTIDFSSSDTYFNPYLHYNHTFSHQQPYFVSHFEQQNFTSDSHPTNNFNHHHEELFKFYTAQKNRKSCSKEMPKPLPFSEVPYTHKDLFHAQRAPHDFHQGPFQLSFQGSIALQHLEDHTQLENSCFPESSPTVRKHGELLLIFFVGKAQWLNLGLFSKYNGRLIQ